MTNFKVLFGCFIVGFIALRETNGANILGLFTTISPSHLIIHMGAMRALADQGHSITVLSVLETKSTHPNIKNIVLPVSLEAKNIISKGQSQAANDKLSTFQMLKMAVGFFRKLQEDQARIYQDDRVRNLIETEKFDLVFLGYFMNEFAIAVAEKLQCPIIVIWMVAPGVLTNSFVGNPEESAYVPNFNIAYKPGEVMGFIKRVKNHLLNLFYQGLTLLQYYQAKSNYEALLTEGKGYKTYYEMRKNISLVFCNSHFSEGIIRPNVPAMVEIGGIQIKEKPDDLPKDIADFLEDSGDDGAILLSFGSNVQSNLLKAEKVTAIYNALASLKQNVIWKWEDPDNTPGNASNIMFKKWVPQDDILANPKIKLFITHAGKGGIAEAQYHAVPMVALPVTGDQPGNAAALVSSGYGLKLDFSDLNEYELKKTIIEVLENPKYADNIKSFSNLYRDRPLTARQSVVFWTEYVLRHKGAKHMQSPLLHLNAVQAMGLDVYAFLFGVVYLFFKALQISLRGLFRLYRTMISRKIKSKIQ